MKFIRGSQNFRDSSPSISTIKKWAAEFKRGRTSLEDDPREGRPKKCLLSCSFLQGLRLL